MKAFLHHLRDTILLLGGGVELAELVARAATATPEDVDRLRNINIKLINAVKERVAHLSVIEVTVAPAAFPIHYEVDRETNEATGTLHWYCSEACRARGIASLVQLPGNNLYSSAYDSAAPAGTVCEACAIELATITSPLLQRPVELVDEDKPTTFTIVQHGTGLTTWVHEEHDGFFVFYGGIGDDPTLYHKHNGWKRK